ncbi:MAG: DUF192 domain-containing protein [Chloroflexi bacterium]|nr:MAG: DUF192 domain-containing protein [Chloroflexota bacterium]
MQVYNLTRRCVLIQQAQLAATFWQRFRGLMGVRTLPDGAGLILVGDKSIHTFFMRFPIDVVYVDEARVVIRTDHRMKPYRIGPFVQAAAYVLEMPAGTIARTGTLPGDRLEFREQPDN